MSVFRVCDLLKTYLGMTEPQIWGSGSSPDNGIEAERDTKEWLLLPVTCRFI